MIKKIQIKGGYGFVAGIAVHFKLMASDTPIKINAVDQNGAEVVYTDMRAPMSLTFARPVARVEFLADTDQTIEIWYSTMPLEYLQLVAVGATRMKTTQKIVPGNVSTKLLDSAPRTKLKLRTDKAIKIASTPTDGGWSIQPGEPEELETSGEVWAVGKNSYFNYLDLAGAHAVLVALQSYGGSYGDNKTWTYFDGHFWGRAQGGAGSKKVDLTGAVTNLNNNGSMFYPFGGKLYQIKPLSPGRSALVSSVDGVNWDIEVVLEGEADNIFNLTSVLNTPFQVGEWLQLNVVGRALAINLLTKEVKTSPPVRLSSDKVMYWPEYGGWVAYNTGRFADDGVFAYEGGTWVKKLSGANSISNGGSLFADELGTMYMDSSDDTKLYILHADFTKTEIVSSAGTGSITRAIIGTSGLLFYNSGGTLSFYREGIDSGSVVISSTAGTFAFYDATLKKLLFILGDSGNIGFNEKAAPDMPPIVSSVVELLEFLV